MPFINKENITMLLEKDIIVYKIGKDTFRKKIVRANLIGNSYQLKVQVLGTQTVNSLTFAAENGKIIFPNDIVGIER
jgi:hypothetical protein